MDVNTASTLSLFLVCLFLLLLLFYIWYSYVYKPYQLFKAYEIPGPAPRAFFGCYKELASFPEGCTGLAAQRHLISNYGPVCGYYLGYEPIVLVSDPELIRDVLIRDFNAFRSRTILRTVRVSRAPDCPTLVSSSDGDWRRLRSTLTPAFSARKLKLMEPAVQLGAEHLVQKIQLLSTAGAATADVRVLVCDYILEVSTSVFFGKSSNLQLRKKGQDGGESDLTKAATAVFGSLREGQHSDFFKSRVYLSAFPWLLPMAARQFERSSAGQAMAQIINLCSELVEERRASEKKHEDFLQLMVDAHDKLTPDEAVAQTTSLLLDGFDSTASAMCYSLYLLAWHPGVQDRLAEEIDSCVGDGKDASLFDSLLDLEYLDMVVNETLRMYPPFTKGFRNISEDTKLGPYTLPGGVVVEVPIYYIHHNPEWWTEPEKFDPERFSPALRDARPPCTFLPFGDGPRNCIGNRFALLEMKMALVKILQQFHIETTSETEIPLKRTNGIVLAPSNRVMLRFVHRNDRISREELN